MKKLLATSLILTLLLTGCFGSFNLTRKVYSFNKSQGDKWAREIVFVVLVVIPVYEFSALADAVIFNSVEFWTGNNPVASHKVTPVPIAGSATGEATVAYDAAQDQVVLDIVEQGRSVANLSFEESEAGVVARDAAGAVRFTATTNPDGSVSVFDGEQRLLKSFSPGQVAALGREQG